MVSRIIRFLNRESSGINDAALLLGLFTFVSQILGLVRDRLLATYVGAGAHLDLYYAAFKIPDFLYVSVATLAGITVLLPFLSQKYGTGDAAGQERARGFLNQVFTALLGLLALVSMVLFIAMPWVAWWVAPGFDAGMHAQLVAISRIMLVQPILIGISNMLSSVTQMFRRFLVAAISPVLYNIGIIFGVVFLYPVWGVTGIVAGVILGAVLHLAVQLPVLARHHLAPRLTTRISWLEIREIVTTSVPRTIGLSMSSFTALILTSIASTLGTGSISIFNLTNNMLNVPIGIVGVSYSVASFPTLVKFFQTNERQKFAEHLLNATRKIIFFSIPIMVLFVVLRAQIVRVILGTNSFSWNDTRIAAACLALFVLGLVAQSLVHLFVRGYYAAGNTKKPLMMNFLGEAFTIGLAVLFIILFRTVPAWNAFFADLLRLNGISNLAILALPLAFSLGNIFNYFALWAVFRSDFPECKIYPLLRTTLQSILASLVAGIASYGGLYIMSLVVNQDRFWGIFAQGAVAAFVGALVFFATMILMGNTEMNEFVQSLHRKFWKAEIVVDQTAMEK